MARLWLHDVGRFATAPRRPRRAPDARLVLTAIMLVAGLLAAVVIVGVAGLP